MAHTFEIRFDRSTGFAGFLEAPENSFRWKGSGQLSIDAQGMSIAHKRGLLSMLTRNARRIPAANLDQVYREGEELRFEFSAPDRPRSVVSCWATDAGTAAQIVHLLPTRRTVELDHSTRPEGTVRYHVDRRALSALLAIAAAMVGAFAWLLREPAPVAAPPMVTAPLIPVEVPLTPPRILVLPDEYLRAIPRSSPLFAVASRELDAFESEAAGLLTDYQTDRTLLESGAMDWETFANRLDNFEFAWWNVTYRILDNREFADLELLELRATLLAAARHWRAFLSGYAEGLRKADQLQIAKSFDQLALAEEFQSRARLFLR
jgi:hypothetical protein